jgi:hypothetical protein
MEVVALELLVPHDYRGVDRKQCAELLDGLLRRLARQEALCRRVLGRLARALLLRRGHLRLGFVRLDDYARERLGVSGRELHDLARVVERLEALPAVAAAFAEGTISWSHVRLLVAVATPETEDAWLRRAQQMPVRALQAAVSASDDDGEETVDGEPRTRFHLRCPRQVRRLWRQAAELASRMAGTRLPAWGAAEAIAAEGLTGVDAVIEEIPTRTTRPGGPLPDLPDLPWEAVTEALPEAVEQLGRFTYGNPFQIDAALRTAVRALQRIDFQTGRLLHIVADLHLHRAWGYRTLPDYVRERLGCSVRKVRALLALDRRLHELPALAAHYREGRLSFARALVLLPVLHPDTEAAWLARAEEVTIRRLGDLVDWAVDAAEPDHPLPPPAAEGPLPPVPVQMCARACDADVTFQGPASVVALLWTAIRAFTPRGALPWQGFERLLLHVMAECESRPRHRDPIFERDGWRCAVPACTARASLHDHHVLYRSRGGDNARDNRVAICAAHHLNGIHRFRIRVSGVAPHDLTWQLGVRVGRLPLMVTHGDRYLEAP